MPAPTDLIDRRFGQLLVLAKAPDIVSPSGKSRRTAWLCRCDCGATEVIGDRRLPHYPSHAARRDVATSCTQCRSTRTCIVCGEVFTSRTRRAVCGTACRAAHDRTLHRDFLDRNPDYYRNYRELVRALDQTREVRSHQAGLSPEAAVAAALERGRASRRAWYAKLSPERRADYLRGMQVYQREYRRRKALEALAGIGDRLLQFSGRTA